MKKHLRLKRNLNFVLIMKVLNYLSQKNRQSQIFIVLQIVFILDRLNVLFFKQTSISFIVFSISILVFVFSIYLIVNRIKKKLLNYNVFLITMCLLYSLLFSFNLLDFIQ
jgi:hypothetical protein